MSEGQIRESSETEDVSKARPPASVNADFTVIEDEVREGHLDRLGHRQGITRIVGCLPDRPARLEIAALRSSKICELCEIEGN
jgi:hypothetical protein